MVVMAPMMVVVVPVVVVEAGNYVNVRNEVMMVAAMMVVVAPVMVVILYLHQWIIGGDRRG
jgi:hypothetical protein